MSPKNRRKLEQARMYGRWAQSAQSDIYRTLCNEFSASCYAATQPVPRAELRAPDVGAGPARVLSRALPPKRLTD